MGFPDSSDSKASAYNAGDPGSIPGSERSPGEGNGNPLQFFLLLLMWTIFRVFIEFVKLLLLLYVLAS